MSNVLCTNGLYSKTLAVVRALGTMGVRSMVSEKVRFHSSGFSRYCKKSLLNPDPKLNPQLYFNWLHETLLEEDVELFIPMDEDTMAIAVENSKELLEICKAPIPPIESYLIASDKGQTMKLSQKAGIPHPNTLQMDLDIDLSERLWLDLVKNIKYPLVIKPRHSSGSRGIRVIHDESQFVQSIQNIHQKYPNPIIQECIPHGDKYDVCLCFDADSKVVAGFVQKEIRHYPIHHGPSTVYQSVYYPELMQLAIDLMKHLPWFGVVDVEFLIDARDGQPKLMEINPRFWSSLHLSIRSGVNFPWILYQLSLGKKIEPVFTYKTGTMGRAILPGDILHFVSNPKRLSLNPPFWSTNIPDDILSWKDPLPTLGFFMSALGYSLDRKVWRDLIQR